MYKNNKPIIVADAATNHGGDIDVAKEMIRVAKECGVDYIKFQSWQTKTMDSKNPAYERMKKKELNDDHHFELIEECKKNNINFLTTCFNHERVDFLSSLGLNTIKVASTDVGSYRMLTLLRNKFKHIILSTGMSYEDEVRKAVDILKSGDFTLLHCVSLYPTLVHHANLRRMLWLKQFTPNVGFSDHTIGTHAAKIAICHGARLIEKHFTLKIDENDVFSKISATPEMLKEICDFAKNYSTYLGNGYQELLEEEKESRDKFVGRWGDNK